MGKRIRLSFGGQFNFFNLLEIGILLLLQVQVILLRLEQRRDQQFFQLREQLLNQFKNI